MPYTNFIGEKKAIQLSKEVLRAAVADNKQNHYRYLETFVAHGIEILPLNLTNILMELIEVNTNEEGGIKFPYEDSLKLKCFFEQFIPTPLQIDLINKQGLEYITKFRNQYFNR